MCTLNFSGVIKNISVNEIRDFIFGNYYKQNWFSKENSYSPIKRLQRKDLLLLVNKLIERIPNLYNVKEH